MSKNKNGSSPGLPEVLFRLKTLVSELGQEAEAANPKPQLDLPASASETGPGLSDNQGVVVPGQPSAIIDPFSCIPEKSPSVPTGSSVAGMRKPQPEISISEGNLTATVPIKTILPEGPHQRLIIEILAENPDRQWSEEERFLVLQVAVQLSLAVQNFRLIQHLD